MFGPASFAIAVRLLAWLQDVVPAGLVADVVLGRNMTSTEHLKYVAMNKNASKRCDARDSPNGYTSRSLEYINCT